MTSYAKFRRYVAMFSLCAVVMSLAPGVAFGSEKRPLDWGNVMLLHDGAPLAVTLFNNQSYRGKVDGLIKADTLPLKTKDGPMAIPRRDIKTIMTYKPTIANPGLYIGVGGVLLATGGGLAGSIKQINELNNGNLNGGSSGTKLEVAGAIVAAGGIAVFILAGKPRTIYEAKQAPPGATK
ncbi:MAG: hypothetical protein ABSG65_16315 [Bryobacteraceae bacterium]|jgi:hypothetical protein